MRRRERFTIPGKYILFVLTVLCVGTMSLSFLTDFDGGLLNTISGYVLIPIQRGINTTGGWMRSRVENLEDLTAVKGENEQLREQIADLTLENNSLLQERYELEELRELYDLDSEYSSLDKIAANIIGKDTGNWFHMFIIDKGYDDGIRRDMNVIAGGGLVGIVTKNGIVLIDFINLMRERGIRLYDAVAQACRSRLRPVLMTSLTTILGMVPMAVSTGEGSETWRPMGVAVIGGMIFSTIITMIIVPAVYAAMDKSGSRNKKKVLAKQFRFMSDFDPERDLPKK